MADSGLSLLTGVGGGHSNVSRLVAGLLLDRGRSVRVMVHRDDGRADALRDRGAEIVVGDLTSPRDVDAALNGVSRAFFTMAVSANYLEAAAVMCALADENGGIEALVNMSQMTVSEMTPTSSEESLQQRLHWLSERIMNWSGLPVVHVRPTVFLDNPLFTLLQRRSIAENGVLALPFGRGHTSPIAATDVARVVAAILQDPAGHIGQVYELTGPAVLDVAGLAEQYSAALGRPVSGLDLPADDYAASLAALGIPSHVSRHMLTVGALHRADRYNRLTDDVEKVTGRPAASVEQYIAAHRDLFVEATPETGRSSPLS
jgi:uncharacterized protein YbjT (DUF2867 family)